MDNDIVRFFTAMPEAIALYEAVESMVLGSIGNASMKVQKSQIAFFTKRSFAYVWLPIRKMKNRPDVYIVLTFGLDRRIESPRIAESVQPYPNRWTHHVIIESTSDVDDEIMGWLRRAYEFSKRTG